MKTPEHFVQRAMTADREQLSALFAEAQADALRHAVERMKRVAEAWRYPPSIARISEALLAEADRLTAKTAKAAQIRAPEADSSHESSLDVGF